jgi:tRNA C32,U32 (ribose-2'-O)-methylase TrmJ
MNSKAAQDTRSEAQVAARLSSIRVVLINTTHPGKASGADDLLQHAVVHDSLESALAGCSLVLGTSARLRSLPMPQMDLRKAAESVLAEHVGQDIAILFGRERYGLTNEEIQCCHQLVHIDTNPDYGSLNLAQAVQVMSYELRMAAVLLDIQFLNPDQPKRLMARLRRLFNRARPDQNEINILRGILAASQRAKKQN